MIAVEALVFSVLVSSARCVDLSFPPGFKFGSATSSYQIEGAWNVSDKGESTWDRFAHRPGVISDGSTGDIACDSYHQWQRDVDIAKELGLHFYRFSINWPRVLPSGLANHISEDGKNYYSNLIDELLRSGIEPVVTMYHWDLPQRLQDLGGWTNPLVSDWFADYARVLYSLYADRVKTWLTINEPLVVCDVAYNVAIVAPGILDPDMANYLCNKHVLMAHAKAWRIYDKEFKHKHNGRVSMANQLLWFEASTPADEDVADLTIKYFTSRFTHAVFSKEGGWPPEIEKIVADNSQKEGYPRSRLPAFTREEIEYIRGTYDFFGMNHYTSRKVRRVREGEDVPTMFLQGIPEIGAVLEAHPDWKIPFCAMFMVYPEGMRRQLAWVKAQYGDMEILITENGACTPAGIEDYDRVQYYRSYLEQILLAIKEDGVNVTGFTAWSLMDNFEWMDGYNSKFGLYEVDFAHPERTRTPRRSARFYAQLIQNHSLDVRDKVEL